ncbi:MAG: hypothetical protein J5669_02635 [Bacteroidales bacterium]|nr:hypothetical protein [Bacteroidales bacterium]
MKKIFSTLAAVIALTALLCSCTKTVKVIPEREREGLPDLEEVEPVSLTLSFVLPAEGSKTEWVEGDQIVVHGEYAKDQVTITLAAADISDGGKKATKTVDGLRPYVREDCSSTLYASYPADAVANIDHCFFYSGFKNTNAPLLAAYNDADNKFVFKPITSSISFQVTEDFDTYAFSGRKDAVVGYEFLQVKFTDNEFVTDYYHKNTLVTVPGVLSGGASATHKVFIPAGLELPDGFELKFYKGGEAKKSLTVKTSTSPVVGEDIPLGDITDQLKEFKQAIDVTTAVSLVENDAANCYIVTAPGVYKFPTVRGNTAEPVTPIETTKVLWETWNNDQQVTEGSLISNTMYEGGQFFIEVPAPFHAGNALVAALDENEKILWSWHIWLPETMPTSDTYGIMSTSELMSRNLGALIDTAPGAPADVRSFGLLYEWGRKDPFMGTAGPGSTEGITYVGTKMTLIDGPISEEDSYAQPTALVNVEAAWADVNDNLLWGDLERGTSAPKSVSDPCPAGYRIPARNYSKIFSEKSNTSQVGFNYDEANYVLQIGDPVTCFPICGYMKNDGTYEAGSSIVWDSRNDYEDGTVSYCMFITGGNAGKSSKLRSYGGTVRCMKE